MATGMEYALSAVFKMMGIEPEAGKKQLGETLQIILQAGAQLNRIEQKLDLVLSGGMMPQEIQLLTGDTNGPERTERHGNGTPGTGRAPGNDVG